MSLRDEVGDTLKSLALRAHSKGIELAWQVHPDVPDYFHTDRVRLRQVLMNLVGNAIKFTSEGEVVVDVTLDEVLPQATRLHFVVSDTGVGIPSQKLDSVFEAFEQADSSTTRQFGGTGLGLAISKKIIQAMNGRVWVESKPGRGSQFHFLVELTNGEVPPNAVSMEELDLTQIPVVIVDDNATNRRILTEMLQSWNMTVRSTADGPSAIEAIRESSGSHRLLPLLISDVHMPTMDGYALAEEIRSSDDMRETVIIMLTSGDHSGDALRRHKLGIAAHMMKPVKQSELQRVIVRLAGRQSLIAAPVSDKPGDKPGIGTDGEPSPVGRLNILLVEDGVANQKLAMALLRKWGHNATLAEKGQQAVDQWRTTRFDVILMDVQMPVMDGLEATRMIRELERASRTDVHIPIVAMTARAMKGDREKCLDAGMDDYLSKPIRRNELFQALRSHVPRSSSHSSDDRPRNHDAASGSESTSDRLIDWNVARSNVDHDDAILLSVVEAGLEELPKLLMTLNEAMASRDSPTAQRFGTHNQEHCGNIRCESTTPQCTRHRVQSKSGKF